MGGHNLALVTSSMVEGKHVDNPNNSTAYVVSVPCHLQFRKAVPRLAACGWGGSAVYGVVGYGG